MRRATPQHALLALILRAAAAPASAIFVCPACGASYDPSDSTASQPHNNVGMPGGCR